MAQAVPHETTARLSDTARHWITAIAAVIGVVAAAVGTWLAYGPSDATVSIFGWTTNVADISDLWAPWLMIGGGLLASVSMGWEELRVRSDANPWVVGFEALILIAGLAAAVTGVILLV
ncbi:MAG: hypothetical protein WAL25_02345 [Acidimicrobiia bacterium]